MRSDPDGEFKYIGHTVVHFGKYHVLLFPLRSKEAAEVVASLERYVFSFFGLPYLLQSDNGIEFVNSLINETLKIWPGKCKIINGSPRKPWVQGCVERYNACVEEMISYRKEDSKINDWVSWLGQIQCK